MSYSGINDVKSASVLEQEINDIYNPTRGESSPEIMRDIAKHINTIIIEYIRKHGNTEHTREVALEHFRKAFPNFAQSYSIVLQYMILFNKFRVDVYYSWVKTLKGRVWRGDKERVDDYSHYVFLLERKMNPKASMEKLRKIKDMVRKSMLDEIKEYEKKEKAARKNVEVEQERIEKKLRDDLYAMLTNSDTRAFAEANFEAQKENPTFEYRARDEEQERIQRNIKNALSSDEYKRVRKEFETKDICWTNMRTSYLIS